MNARKFLCWTAVFACSMLLVACAAKKDQTVDEDFEDVSFEELEPELVEQDVMADEYLGAEVEALPGEADMEIVTESYTPAGHVPARPGRRPATAISRPYARSTVGYPEYDSGSAPRSGPSYTVRQGDSLWTISRQHGTTVRAIADANGISPSAIIRPGQQLVIPTGGRRASASPAAPPAAGGTTYTVQKGDSYYSIGKKLGVGYKRLMEYNGATSSLLREGQVIRIP